ncbi:MAG: histidine triad nucleotide-binding protein [bacterium]
MKDCLFCKIIKKDIPSAIVFEDDEVTAFRDISPQAPVHILIVPKQHIATLMDLTEKDKDIIGHIFLVARQLAEKEGVGEKGFRVVANCNAAAGQAVFHVHFHLLGGRRLQWPPG